MKRKERLYIGLMLWTFLQTLLPAQAQNTQYADHSVLAEGRWVKICVPETGIYMLSDSLLRQAGFERPEQVCVYGYGGALQPEKLTPDYLTETDDLQEVPVCNVEGRLLFHAVGPVNWTAADDGRRVRNHYARSGYYFLTERTQEPVRLDSATFAETCYPLPNDYHALHEVDDFYWYHGGRNLYEHQPLAVNTDRNYQLTASSTKGRLTVVMSYNGYCEATVLVNDSVVGSILINKNTVVPPLRHAYPDEYSKAAVDMWTFDASNLNIGLNTITLRQKSGSVMRLDYMVLTSREPRPLPAFSQADFPQPQVVGDVRNQDLHAHALADMVIIVPASNLLARQAEELRQLHETYDNQRVNIVRADELFNEFSSGTPDANAYRRYLKMLYDRADTTADRPRFLLLMGDCAWDNRMLTSDWRQTSPDDFLLCYESDNSVSETDCFVTDDFFCVLDDNRGDDLLKNDQGVVAVGRLTARTPEEAQVMVDKIRAYRLGQHAGDWQNTICLMADDGNANLHMEDAEEVFKVLNEAYESYDIRKIYWDAYMRVSTSSGNTFPDVAQLVHQRMQTGALIMNYSGHGNANYFSHEQVGLRSHFAEPALSHLPLWVTASCDIMPFDTHLENIGETAILNPTGGAIAFFGTTRTVYAQHNRPMNKAFMYYVLGTHPDGSRITIGQAARMAKNQLTTGSSNRQFNVNKLHFCLLGDPALTLAAPTLTAVIDSLDGLALDEADTLRFVVGQHVRVAGHIEGQDDFNGRATLNVFDAKQTIVCHMHSQPSDQMPLMPMTFETYPSVLTIVTDSVRDGRFSFTFAVPRDMAYSDSTGLMLVYAVNEQATAMAHGHTERFTLGWTPGISTDGEGPTIACWLDSKTFTNGGVTGRTPYFYAELYDEDGINISEQGVGHNIELVIDGQMSYTYDLNPYFVFDFGDFRRGVVGFRLPELADGDHSLRLRAWDVLNHPATTVLNFTVDPTVHIPSAINAVLSDETLNRHRQMDEGRLYDAAGRYVGTFRTAQLQQASLPSGLYIFRSATGITKKIMIRRQ
jgi:hypothetical protein